MPLFTAGFPCLKQCPVHGRCRPYLLACNSVIRCLCLEWKPLSHVLSSLLRTSHHVSPIFWFCWNGRRFYPQTLAACACSEPASHHSLTVIHKASSSVHPQAPVSPSRKPSLTSPPSRNGFFFKASVTWTLLLEAPVSTGLWNSLGSPQQPPSHSFPDLGSQNRFCMRSKYGR